MLVFDELPTATLMDPSGERIDAKRFPGFAKLAAQSTWYRNNTAAADFTGRAVPAIRPASAPTSRPCRPPPTSRTASSACSAGKYRINVDEVVTERLPTRRSAGEEERPPQKHPPAGACSRTCDTSRGKLILPPALANDLPNVSATFGNFGNNDDDGQYAGQFAQDLFVPPSPEQFNDFFSGSSPGRSLNLIHIELPHEPFHFLPDGREYNFTPISDVAGPNAQKWAGG